MKHIKITHRLLNLDLNPTLADTCLAIKMAAIPLCISHYTKDEVQGWIDYCEHPNHKDSFKDVTIMAAYTDKKMVGFIAYTSSSIDNLFILPNYAGNNIGSGLLDKAIAHIKKLSPISGKITVRASLNAKEFYCKHGFKAVGTDISKAGFDIILMDNQ